MDREDRVLIGGIGYCTAAVSIGTGSALLYGEGYGLLAFGAIIMTGSLIVLWHVAAEARR